MVNKGLIRLYFWGGTLPGRVGWLAIILIPIHPKTAIGCDWYRVSFSDFAIVVIPMKPYSLNGVYHEWFNGAHWSRRELRFLHLHKHDLFGKDNYWHPHFLLKNSVVQKATALLQPRGHPSLRKLTIACMDCNAWSNPLGTEPGFMTLSTFHGRGADHLL